HHAPRLGLGRAGALVVALGDERLVQDGVVRLDAEDGVVHFDAAQLLALGVDDRDLHFLAFRPVRRTFTRTPSFPGTAPLTISMPFAESERTTLRFLTVAWPVPMWPAIFSPLITRPGSVPAPMEPGARAPSDSPWVFGPPWKPWRFMTPAKPWPLVAPETSTMSPGSKISQPTFLPTSHSPISSTRSSRR